MSSAALNSTLAGKGFLSMVLIAECSDWLPEQPWDQGWNRPVASIASCWLPAPPIACEWLPIEEPTEDQAAQGGGAASTDSTAIDPDDGGSDPSLWAVGEPVVVDPITGTEVLDCWEFPPVLDEELSTVEPQYEELTSFAELTEFIEFPESPGFPDAEADDTAKAEVPPYDSGEALNGTGFIGKPYQICTKPYFFSPEESLPFLESQHEDSAVQGEEPSHELIEAGEELICVDLETCEPVDDAAAETFNDGSDPSLESEPPVENAFSEDWVEHGEARGDEDMDPSVSDSDSDWLTGFVLTVPEWWSTTWYDQGSGAMMMCGISHYFFDDSDYTIDDASGEQGDDSGVISTDPDVWFIQDFARPVVELGGIHEEGDISEPVPVHDPTVLRGNGEDPTTFQAVPSEDSTYRRYLNFLKDNPEWAADHGAGGLQLQVITPSAHLPWIDLSTPGAARAFDTWYEQTQLTQSPPEDQPSDPAVDPAADPTDPIDPRKREFRFATRSLNLFEEAFPSTLPLSASTTEAVLARQLPQVVSAEVASAGGTTIEPFEISIQPRNLRAEDSTPIALRPALAVAASSASATQSDGASPALAGGPAADQGDNLAPTGDFGLAAEEAGLLLEQLNLSALPWWLVRPTRR